MQQILALLLADAVGTTVALASASLSGWLMVYHINKLRQAL